MVVAPRTRKHRWVAWAFAFVLLGCGCLALLIGFAATFLAWDRPATSAEELKAFVIASVGIGQLVAAWGVVHRRCLAWYLGLILLVVDTVALLQQNKGAIFSIPLPALGVVSGLVFVVALYVMLSDAGFRGELR